METFGCKRYHCMSCNTHVQMHYDHVGDCETGKCDGTFKHPSNRGDRNCRNRGQVVGHKSVEAR